MSWSGPTRLEDASVPFTLGLVEQDGDDWKVTNTANVTMTDRFSGKGSYPVADPMITYDVTPEADDPVSANHANHEEANDWCFPLDARARASGMTPFPYSSDNKRYHTYAYFLKRRYGVRTARVPLDGGFTCPNRDGTLGVGGCAFCSGRGSGDQIAALPSLEQQYAAGIEKLRGKWPDARYIPYFQAFSGTYAAAAVLRARYDRALALPGAAALAVATRADCISEDIADLLAEYAARTDLTVELGLQTIMTARWRAMNRCETF